MSNSLWTVEETLQWPPEEWYFKGYSHGKKLMPPPGDNIFAPNPACPDRVAEWVRGWRNGVLDRVAEL